MSTEYICDACGKRQPTKHGGKPGHWYARTVEVDGSKQEQHACSRDCISKLGGLVLPI